MTNQTEQNIGIDITRFVSNQTNQEDSSSAPPPLEDFDEEAIAEMVSQISAYVLANDLPAEAWAALPSPKYLVQFYKLIQLKKASGYLTKALNPDPKTILVIGGIGTAAYVAWMWITAAKIKKHLGLAGVRQAGEERRREWEQAAKEIQEAKEGVEERPGSES
ncbi:MAG: hypothetical protein QXI19_10465 [Candidatus Caldarchaeum sp.]